LGNITYIYGVSPDFIPGTLIQENNGNPAVKIEPKKSWEIADNPYGVNICEPGPRSPQNDSQPMLPIHLIDGDPLTAWSSIGCAVPDGQPEWIRIDLPVETDIASVALVCNPDFARGDLYSEGKLLDRQEYHEWAACALPDKLTVQISRDAWHWETVYETDNLSGDERGKTGIDFPVKRAKQIIITGNNFRRRLSKYDGYCFSVASVEVCKPDGANLALVSKGAGVTVSSTGYLMDHDRYTQSLLFGPVQYDLGLKWLRIGADNGMLTWNYVEREKGVFSIDPAMEELLADMNRSGVNIIMNLDVKANWLYRGEQFGEIADPADYVGGYIKSRDFTKRGTKPDWKLARIYEMNNIYYDFPGWAFETEEMFEGYLKYVDFMVEHFRGRVAYYEVGNEWGDNREVYIKAVKRIKKNDPGAKIMVCVGRMPTFPIILENLLRDAAPEERAMLMPDAVGSHPGTRIDAGMTLDNLNEFYWEENRQAMKDARVMGYKGIFIASEVYSWTHYPPGPFEIDPGRPGISKTYGIRHNDPAFCGESEIVRAKYLAQNFIGHAGLGMMAFQCNTYFVSCGSNGQGLFRLPVPSQVVSPVQPDAGYYTFRTVCSVMDGWKNSELSVSFSSRQAFQSFAYKRGDNEYMLAVWIPGDTGDEVRTDKTDITIGGVTAERAFGIDVINGVEQELYIERVNGGICVRGILVKDYPTLIRLEK